MQLLGKSGAKEVHFRIFSPPIRFPCNLGVDMPTRRELAAHSRSVEDMREFNGADSLGYLSVEGMASAVETSEARACMACFTANSPIPVPA